MVRNLHKMRRILHKLQTIRRNGRRDAPSIPPNGHFGSAKCSLTAAEMTHFRRLARLLPPPCNKSVVFSRKSLVKSKDENQIPAFVRDYFKISTPHYRT